MTSTGVSSLTANTTPSATSGSSNTDSLGKEAFLTLLVAQLQNQDPLKPMDSTDFTAQLAQFSSLETMTNISSSIDGLVSSQTTATNTNAVGFIGKTITAQGSNLTVSGGSVEQAQYALESNATSVNIQINDSSGNVVRTLTQENVASGTNVVSWDGKDKYGNTVSDGDYTYTVTAADSSGIAINASTTKSGTVTSVGYEQDKAYLYIGTVKIALSDVTQVK